MERYSPRLVFIWKWTVLLFCDQVPLFGMVTQPKLLTYCANKLFFSKISLIFFPRGNFFKKTIKKKFSRLTVFCMTKNFFNGRSCHLWLSSIYRLGLAI